MPWIMKRNNRLVITLTDEELSGLVTACSASPGAPPLSIWGRQILCHEAITAAEPAPASPRGQRRARQTQKLDMLRRQAEAKRRQARMVVMDIDGRPLPLSADAQARLLAEADALDAKAAAIDSGEAV